MIEYIQKHNLLDKYFNDFSNFNSIEIFMKEGYRTFSLKNKNNNFFSKTPIYALEKTNSIGNYQKISYKKYE